MNKKELKSRIESLKKDYKSGIEYALFKLDDKPGIAWADLLAAAHLSGSSDAIEACKIMLKIGKTPQKLLEMVEKQNG